MRTSTLAAIAMSLAVATTNAQSALPARSAAPGFSLRDLSGRPLTLAEYRGRVVLLDFWATWCAPCREEIPRFASLQKKYRDRGFVVIGISMDDDPAPVVRAVRELRINYRVAIGDAELAGRYGGVLGLPVTFLIDRDGQIHERHDGPAEAAALEHEIVQLLKGNPRTR